MSSKAYAATFPCPSEVQLRRLDSWARDNCWKSTLATKNGRTSWVAIREKTSSAEQWTRHVAKVLGAIGIDPRDLRLQLCSAEEADKHIIKRMRSESTPVAASMRTAQPVADQETKIIELSANSAAGRRKGTGATTKRKVRKIEVARE